MDIMCFALPPIMCHIFPFAVRPAPTGSASSPLHLPHNNPCQQRVIALCMLPYPEECRPETALLDADLMTFLFVAWMRDLSSGATRARP
jgi:hypothetical protein